MFLNRFERCNIQTNEKCIKHILFIESMIVFFIVSICSVFSYKRYAYLTYPQQEIVKRIIQHKDITPVLRNKINILLYKQYEYWAIGEAHKFKYTHRHKCKNIPVSEFILASRFGLYNACLKYNGSIKFYFYALIHIKCQLYNALTDLYPLSNVPAKERKKGKYRRTGQPNIPTTFVSNDQEYLLPVASTIPYEKVEEKNEYSEIWTKINNTTDSFYKRCLYYRFDYEFNEIRSYKHIAELMCCSEEYVRRKIINQKIE